MKKAKSSLLMEKKTFLTDSKWASEIFMLLQAAALLIQIVGFVDLQ